MVLPQHAERLPGHGGRPNARPEAERRPAAADESAHRRGAGGPEPDREPPPTVDSAPDSRSGSRSGTTIAPPVPTPDTYRSCAAPIALTNPATPAESAAAARIARTLRLVVGEWRWPVVPGVHLTRAGTCSCGEDCAEPGAHPVDTASWLAASADPDRVREWWLAAPLAAIVLPVGWHVDVIDAPEAGGREALGRLEMMGYRPAPAISTASGRLLFLVASGARRTADFAERGRPRGRKRAATGGPALPTQPGPETGLWLGGDCSGAPDIVVRRRGVLVLPPIGPEPPGKTRWLVEPDQVRRPLPRPEDLLGPIVHACRDVAARRGKAARPVTVRRPTAPSTVEARPATAPSYGPGGDAVDRQPAVAGMSAHPTERSTALPVLVDQPSAVAVSARPSPRATALPARVNQSPAVAVSARPSPRTTALPVLVDQPPAVAVSARPSPRATALASNVDGLAAALGDLGAGVSVAVDQLRAGIARPTRRDGQTAVSPSTSDGLVAKPARSGDRADALPSAVAAARVGVRSGGAAPAPDRASAGAVTLAPPDPDVMPAATATAAPPDHRPPGWPSAADPPAARPGSSLPACGPWSSREAQAHAAALPAPVPAPVAGLPSVPVPVPAAGLPVPVAAPPASEAPLPVPVPAWLAGLPSVPVPAWVAGLYAPVPVAAPAWEAPLPAPPPASVAGLAAPVPAPAAGPPASVAPLPATGPWARRAVPQPRRRLAAVPPALAGAACAAGSRRVTLAGPPSAIVPPTGERAPVARAAVAALGAAHPAASGGGAQPALRTGSEPDAGQPGPGDTDPRCGGPRPRPRHASVRPAGGAVDRRAVDRRAEAAASAAWKERLRRVRPEPPPAPA